MFYAYSTDYDNSLVTVENVNGTPFIRHGAYQNASVDANGYIVVTNTSGAVNSKPVEAVGWG